MTTMTNPPERPNPVTTVTATTHRGKSPHRQSNSTTRQSTGYVGPIRDAAKWAMAIQATYGFLIGVARTGTTVEYGDIYKLVEAAIGMEIDRWHASDLLDAVSKKAVASHGVMLSSLVVRQREGLPGFGLRRLAAELGRTGPRNETDEAFVERLQRECWEAFRIQQATVA